MIDKAYKCRLYPNKEQVALIEKTFGACRWLWNTALEMKSAKYKVDKKTLGMYDIQGMIKVWKHGVAPWLVDPPNSALVETNRDLEKAFKNFFRRVKSGENPGYPKFKSKRDHTQSYRTQCSGFRIIDDKHMRLPKLGTVRCRITQQIEGRPLNVTVKRVPSGKYYAIICCTDVPEPEMPMGENQVLGIDAGVKDLMTRSDGVKVPNNKHLAESQKKLRREQRKLSRRKKGSANWEKQRVKVARLQEKIANQRRDDLHKATIDAVRDSRAIAVEDLNVEGMKKEPSHRQGGQRREHVRDDPPAAIQVRLVRSRLREGRPLVPQ